MKRMNLPAREKIFDGITIAYFSQLLAGLIVDDPASWSSPVLVSTCIVSMVAGMWVHGNRHASRDHGRAVPPVIDGCIQATGTILVVIIAWIFLTGADVLPGRILGIPVAFFFLPEFTFSLVALVTLERGIAGLIATGRETRPAWRDERQNTLKCKAEARSIRPS